jgi:uncharacterized protein (DUF983 family)
MTRIVLKQCPRCHNGQLLIERDHFGAYVRCLQCGYYRDAGEPALPYVINMAARVR